MVRSWAAVILGMITLVIGAGMAAKARAGLSQPREGEVAVMLTGGHDTVGEDRGRPVVLIAAALGVPTEVFREAFTHVHPAKGAGGPTGEQARQNKHELLNRLEKYGVTNERLDEVSNYYRYRRQDGEMWTHRDAVIFAVLKNGIVTGFRIADAGAGYSSSPVLAIEGQPSVSAKVRLHFEKDLAKNGSIESVVLAPPTTAH